MEKLFLDHFLKNQKSASKYIESKQQTACIYLIQSFFKKQKEIWN